MSRPIAARAVPSTVEVQGPEFPHTRPVAIVASFSATPRVTLSLATLLNAFLSREYGVVLVRASDDPAPLEWPGPAPDVTVIRKPNVGFDFGSWAVGLDRFPELTSSRRVLFANDSLVGPFDSIDPLLRDFESCPADIWGAVRSREHLPHVQSYLFGMRPGVLGTRLMRSFWGEVIPATQIWDVVRERELALAALAYSEAYTTRAAIEPVRANAGTSNPSLKHWRGLVDAGFPFIKRKVLTGESGEGSPVEARAFVRERFGIDADDWL